MRIDRFFTVVLTVLLVAALGGSASAATDIGEPTALTAAAGANDRAVETARIEFEGAPGEYTAVLVEGEAASDSAAVASYAVDSALTFAEDLVQRFECVSPSDGSEACVNVVAPLSRCHIDLMADFSYYRGTPGTETAQDVKSTATMVCPSGVNGVVRGDLGGSIRDRGVPAGGGLRYTNCPGGTNIGGTCTPGLFTSVNQTASGAVSQTVPVVILPAEAHGAGSVYEFTATYAFRIPELFGNEMVHACASGQSMDPANTLDVNFALARCPQASVAG